MWSCVWELCCSTLPWSYWESPPPALMCKVHSATWAPPSSTVIWLLFHVWTDGGVYCMLVKCITSNSATWHWLIVLKKVSGGIPPSVNIFSRPPSGHPHWDSPSSLALSLSRLGGFTTSLARSLQGISTKPSSRWEQVLGCYECGFREGIKYRWKERYTVPSPGCILLGMHVWLWVYMCSLYTYSCKCMVSALWPHNFHDFHPPLPLLSKFYACTLVPSSPFLPFLSLLSPPLFPSLFPFLLPFHLPFLPFLLTLLPFPLPCPPASKGLDTAACHCSYGGSGPCLLRDCYSNRLDQVLCCGAKDHGRQCK